MAVKKYHLVFFSLALLCLLTPLPTRAIENNECMECHGDPSLERVSSEGMQETLVLDFAKFKHSVHNINEVGCIDCHSDIQTLNYDEEVPHPTSLAIVNCSGCHEIEGEAYKNSVHKKAGAKGLTIPCYACHGYHYVTRLEGSSVYERENRFCLKCHDPYKFHDWLPQKANHFDHVECTVCHAPDAPRHIHLQFYDLVSNKVLGTEDKLAALDTDFDGFFPLLDANKDGIINVNEFEDMVFLLKQKGIRGTFHGELLSEVEPGVHHVNRGKAKRECEACHMPTSPFFESVTIVLENEDSTLEHYPVERKVLETYYVNHFYALGGTRVRILDKFGGIMLALGLLVVVSHLTMRVISLPARTSPKKRR